MKTRGIGDMTVQMLSSRVPLLCSILACNINWVEGIQVAPSRLAASFCNRGDYRGVNLQRCIHGRSCQEPEQLQIV
jgi:hypothetical protein